MNDLTRPSTSDPATAGTDLKPRQRDAMRASLLAEQSASEAQIAELTRSFEDIVEAVVITNNDDEHDPEGTTIAFERAQVAALLNQAKADLEAIQVSLKRLEDGTYGRCQVCERAIGVARLTAIPSAAKCIDCA